MVESWEEIKEFHGKTCGVKRNDKGLLCSVPTTFSIPPDPHCCSFNRLKYLKIEQGDQAVFLTKWEVEELAKYLEKL